MLWIIVGFMLSVFASLTMLANQKYRIDGNLIAAVRGVGVGLVCLPALFFLSPPTAPLFWILIVLQGVFSGVYNAKLYTALTRYGAGSTSRINAIGNAVFCGHSSGYSARPAVIAFN